MKIVVAMDSFKGSLTSLEAGDAVRRGLLSARPDATVTVRALADGGEGTADAIVSALGGEMIQKEVTGPLGTPVTAKYGYLPARETAVIEMAEAAGLPLVPPEARDPLYTTTFGVGELILDALGRGCRRFLVGLGGSATNDGGAGMLSALGISFLNGEGKPIPRGAIGLRELASIDTAQADGRLWECTFTVACDVKNPLCGEEGCSHVFAPQKGGTEETVPQMDLWLKRYADLTQEALGRDLAKTPGAGAAGGMGFAFLAYLSATLTPGIDLVTREIGLDADMEGADLVVTGEGRLDGQSAMGKTPVGVAALAKRYNIPVIALAGSVGEGADAVNGAGIDAFFPILRRPCTLSEAMDPQNAAAALSSAAEQALRLFLVGARKGE